MNSDPQYTDNQVVAAEALSVDLLARIEASGFDEGLATCVIFNVLIGYFAARLRDRERTKRALFSHWRIAMQGFEDTDFMDFLPKKGRH